VNSFEIVVFQNYKLGSFELSLNCFLLVYNFFQFFYFCLVDNLYLFYFFIENFVYIFSSKITLNVMFEKMLPEQLQCWNA
jgi:hypothetical protein